MRRKERENMSKPAFNNGYVDGSGSSSYAARKDHNHSGSYAAANHNHDNSYEPKNALLLKAAPVTIAAADWEEKAATVDYPTGLTSYVSYVVAAGSAAAATAAALVLSSAGESGLNFAVTTPPETDLDLFILYC